MSAVVIRRASLSPDEELRARKLQSQGSASHLSTEQEAGPFMMFLFGDDVEGIAAKTHYPKDVVLLTALHYKWEEKRELLVEKGKESELVKNIEKSLLNNILLATYQAINKDVGEVIAGKKQAQDSKFIPQSMQALKSLLEMVEKANKLVAAGNEPAPAPAATTVVHAQNVQFVTNEAPADADAKRRKYLQELADSEGV